jgi:hypothetical protein
MRAPVARPAAGMTMLAVRLSVEVAVVELGEDCGGSLGGR